MDIAVAFNGVEPMLRNIVAGVVQRYGGDFDELLSEAYFAFCRYAPRFDATRGAKFSTYINFQVRTELLSTRRKELSRRVQYTEDDLDTPCEMGPDWTAELGEDARVVLDLILTTPSDLAAMVATRRNGGGAWRTSLRKYLEAAGWTADRVLESFDEIKEAMRT